MIDDLLIVEEDAYTVVRNCAYNVVSFGQLQFRGGDRGEFIRGYSLERRRFAPLEVQSINLLGSQRSFGDDFLPSSTYPPRGDRYRRNSARPNSF